ncbi:hypothetical protein M0813_04195 [Anaeramoeba flamelloides]|uniref:Uncharacterized protein n=1 Tax=Anaeramoeba flamelloides TaxID=1746091 RepID=A0ABQ8XLZ5_9EUKA|nr:hypothetical protein M0813_04195 [Anaeramoeba flamelloides]
MANHNNSQIILKETQDIPLYDQQDTINGQEEPQLQNSKSKIKNIPKKIQEITGIFETTVGIKPSSSKNLELVRSTQINKPDIPKPNKLDSKNLQKNNFQKNKQKSHETFQEKQNTIEKSSDPHSLYVTNISSSEESNNEKKTIKKKPKNQKKKNNKKKKSKKKKSNSKNKSKRAIIQINPKDNCPFCLKPKDGPQHPFVCDYLKDLIHTKIQKRKFKNCLVRLRISSCKQGKDFINTFIENSKCHENKIINTYLNNGKEINNSNTRVGVQGRQNRYDNLRTMMNNNQNNSNLRKNLNPNNP